MIFLDPPRDGEEEQSLLIEHGDPAAIGLDAIDTREANEIDHDLNAAAFIARNLGKRLASCHPARRAA